MRYKILFFLSLLILGTRNAALADDFNIHVIVFCDTDDPKIGGSCLNDQKRFVNEMGTIQTALDCDIDWTHVYTGSECNNPNLQKELSNLNCSSNDVIIFYYSGHGVHAESDNGWLPQMCLGYESYDQDKFVSVEKVQSKLSKKGARLTLILSDCCNVNASWVTPKSLLAAQVETTHLSDVNVANLKKLFLESRGTIIATSSKRGQTSLGPEEGGLFSIAFWDEMIRVEKGLSTADWKNLFDETRNWTLQYSGGKQEPVYEVNVNMSNNGGGGGSNGGGNVTPIVISVNEVELGNVFKQVLSPSMTRLQRSAYAKQIAESYFTANAQVFVVGRNMTTIVGNHSIAEYLEQLAYSKTVKAINIVSVHKENNKINEITLCETR